jgi:hypothetical protein
MSQRLQVLLDEAELREIRKLARRERMSVAEWVRGALRRARRQAPERPTQAKRAAVDAALTHSYPTTDIDTMLAEIERGYAPTNLD